MSLTVSQLTALKLAILADPVLAAQPLNSEGAFAIALALNLEAVPPFVVWRTNVPTADMKKAMVWTEFIARSAGEREAWQFMLANGIVDASQVNVRQGVQDIFSGPGGAGSRAAIVAIVKRNATRAEQILATGIGTTAAPATLSFEGRLTFQDVEAARAS